MIVYLVLYEFLQHYNWIHLWSLHVNQVAPAKRRKDGMQFIWTTFVIYQSIVINVLSSPRLRYWQSQCNFGEKHLKFVTATYSRLIAENQMIHKFIFILTMLQDFWTEIVYFCPGFSL